MGEIVELVGPVFVTRDSMDMTKVLVLLEGFGMRMREGVVLLWSRICDLDEVHLQFGVIDDVLSNGVHGER